MIIIRKKIIKKVIAIFLAIFLLTQPYGGIILAQEISPTPEVAAENSQTGDASANEAVATENSAEIVENNNQTEITDSVTTDSNSGNNQIVETLEPTPTTSDVAEISPSNELGASPTEETIPQDQPCCEIPSEETPASDTDNLDPTVLLDPQITPIPVSESISVEEETTPSINTEASPTSTPEPASIQIEETTDSPSVPGASNENTGDNSNNTAATLTESVAVVENTNNAQVDNVVVAEANTGDNQIESEDAEIETDNAVANSNLVNFINTNLVGTDFWQMILNYYGNGQGEIDLSQIDRYVAANPELEAYLAQNLNTGEDSVNIAIAAILSSFSVYNTNTATLTNDVDANANTGGNQIVGEDGQITTGNADASVNLANFVNTNLVGEDWFFAMINLFADYNGNIVLPYEWQFLLDDPNGSYSQALAANQNTGEGSENTALSGETNLTEFTNVNQSSINNDVDVTANTGNNTIAGEDSQITTGNANALANLVNITNTNIFGSNWILLVINNSSNWTGKVVGWWGQLYSFGNTTFAFMKLPGGIGGQTSQVEALNNDTGEDSQNTAVGASLTNFSVTNQNQATVVNDVDVTADTGNNIIDGEDSNIQTGNANASANVLNVVNTNIFGNHWYFAMINLFGNFIGDIIFPRAELAVSKSVNKLNANSGEEIAYMINYQNQGRISAQNVQIIDTIPSGVSFISCSGGCANNGSQIVWQIAQVSSGQSGQVSLVLRINSDFSGNLVNYANITSNTMETTQNNNSSSVSTSVNQPGQNSDNNNNDNNNSGSTDDSDSNNNDSSSSDSTDTSTFIEETFGGIVLAQANFAGETLGGSTDGFPETQIEEENLQEVKTASSQVCYWWWLILIVQGIALGMYYMFLDRKLKNWWIAIPLSGFLAWLADQLAHQFYSPAIYCSWTWLFALGVAIIITISVKRLVKGK